MIYFYITCDSFMDKKFMASLVVCFVALTMVAAGTYYIGQKKDEKTINVKKIARVETTVDSENIEAAQNTLGKEVTTEGDRVSIAEEQASSYEGETKIINEEPTTVKVVEENTASNMDKKDDMYGLSSEAAAVVSNLKFNKNSKLLWPVEGNILLEYNMENTVYFSTLDEYKCSPAIAIQSKEGAEVKAAAKGVVTELGQNDEYGVYMKVAMGNDYFATYGQIINPQYEVGQTVEAGSVIGYVNKPTSSYEKEGDNLYFQVTKKNKPKDPLKYMDYQD